MSRRRKTPRGIDEREAEYRARIEMPLASDEVEGSKSAPSPPMNERVERRREARAPRNEVKPKAKPVARKAQSYGEFTAARRVVVKAPPRVARVEPAGNSRHAVARARRELQDAREGARSDAPGRVQGLPEISCKPRPKRASGRGTGRPYVPWCKK